MSTVTTISAIVAAKKAAEAELAIAASEIAEKFWKETGLSVRSAAIDCVEITVAGDAIPRYIVGTASIDVAIDL
jgi:hypothetical protein